MTPQRIMSMRMCIRAGLAALSAIEVCQEIEAKAASMTPPHADDPSAWSYRCRAERQREEGVKARAQAEAALALYRRLKAEAEHAQRL
jgi:hypothetical protein